MSSEKLNNLLNAREIVARLRDSLRVEDNPALAEKTGMTPQTFYQWENGDQDLGAKTLLTLSFKYHIDLNWLLFGEEVTYRNPFNEISERLINALSIEANLTSLQKEMPFGQDAFSHWKQSGFIPDYAILKCWRNHEVYFDLNYVLSGKQTSGFSKQRRLEKEITFLEGECNLLKEKLTQYHLRLEHSHGKNLADEIFEVSDAITIPETTNDTEPQKRNS